ncbi:ribonuclease HIII [Candidatus Marinamargulisbacteria bacterium SCGC AG-439-L15]|nr:ribonuclease HIII [Candidatus Marinamargulisbacteria bacterium SCGC AG-439-L15]
MSLKKAFIDCLLSSNLTIISEKDIPYGYQVSITDGIDKGVVRLYEGKKGPRLDFSQLKSDVLVLQLRALFEKQSKLKVALPKQDLSPDDRVDFPELIGVDESGKGDYFGPLVVASVYVDQKRRQSLSALGVKDSKQLTDSVIRKLAPKIKSCCPYDIITINNPSYNRLYAKMKNLNKLLAWGHARSIENLLSKQPCKVVLSDQFANPSLVENALFEKGREIHLIQRTKAERYSAVAAASILARDHFLLSLETLSQEFDLSFPRGMSSKTISVGKSFVRNYGKEALLKVAKYHFSTTEKIS